MLRETLQFIAGLVTTTILYVVLYEPFTEIMEYVSNTSPSPFAVWLTDKATITYNVAFAIIYSIMVIWYFTKAREKEYEVEYVRR